MWIRLVSFIDILSSMKNLGLYEPGVFFEKKDPKCGQPGILGVLRYKP
jgi:hypothetical protein